MKIKELLSNIDNSVLTEESKSEISKVFEEVVSEQVTAQLNEKVEVAVNLALVEQDESHEAQLGQILEAIDADHSTKLQKMVENVDKEHTKKLEGIVGHYEQLLGEESKKLVTSLQTDISNFLDLTLDDLLPKDMLKEAVANTKATRKLKKIQEMVSVDEDFINESIREALDDGREQIESLRENMNTVLKENVRLSASNSKIGSELIIERKTKNLKDEKRLFVEQTFKGKSVDYVEENFDYALKMFERREQEVSKVEKVQVLTESVAATVDTPKEKSNVETTNEFAHVSEYVSGLE